MKKILIAVVALVVMSLATGSSADPAYIGAWAITDEFMEGKTEMTMFQLNEDHSVYFMLQWFFTGFENPGMDSRWVGHWEEDGPDAFIITRDGSDKVSRYKLVNENEIVDSNGSSCFRVGTIPYSYHEYLEANPTEDPNPTTAPETVYAEIPYDLIAVAVDADPVDESYYPGIWVNIMQHADGTGETVKILHLTEGHETYFTVQSIKSDGSDGFGRSAFKSWDATGNKIHVVIGNNSALDLRVIDENRMYDLKRPQDIYTRLDWEESGEQHD